MQKYFGNDYSLTVSRCKMDDAGAYMVQASNSFGTREEKCHLTVECKFYLHNQSTKLLFMKEASTVATGKYTHFLKIL